MSVNQLLKLYVGIVVKYGKIREYQCHVCGVDSKVISRHDSRDLSRYVVMKTNLPGMLANLCLMEIDASHVVDVKRSREI